MSPVSLLSSVVLCSVFSLLTFYSSPAGASSSAYPPPPSYSIAPSQVAILQSLAAHWGYFPESSSWTQRNSCDNWQGITCDSTGMVTGIDIGARGLSGTVPVQLLQLKQLSNILLSGNSFTGPFPVFLFQLPYLVQLDLSYNYLSGTLPPFPAAKYFTSLNLAGNRFTGPIPTTISKLTQLSSLVLDSNAFSGSIPPSLGSCVNMQTLHLNHNKLTGVLPPSLTALRFLQDINLRGNSLSGRLPSNLTAWGALFTLDLSENFFTGPAPSGWTQPFEFFSNMFDIHSNYFTGSATILKAGAPFCATSEANNCLTYPSSFACTREIQRSSSDCAYFCGTGTAAGQCGGHGVCMMGAPPTSKPYCVCDAGYAAVTTAPFKCVKQGVKISSVPPKGIKKPPANPPPKKKTNTMH